MQSANRLLLKNTWILYARLIFTSIIGLFTSRLVINSLGDIDFGLYNVVGGLIVMMTFLNTVLISTTFRFIAFEIGNGDDASVNKVFNISLVIHLLMALSVFILTETLGVYYVLNYLNIDSSKINDSLFVLRFSTYSAIFSIISMPHQGLIVATENFKFQAIVDTIRSLLGLMIGLIILNYTGNKLRLYALLIALVNLIPATLFYIQCYTKHYVIVKWKFQRDISKYREMAVYSGWTMLGAAASVGQSTGSTLIINSFFGNLLNAAYGIANQVNNIVNQFSGSLNSVAVPQITKSFSGGDTDRTFNLTIYVTKYSFFVVLLLTLPILLETEFLLTQWLGILPPYTIIFSRLLLINTIVYSLNSGLPAYIQATGKIKYFQLFGSFIAIIGLPITYLLFNKGFPPFVITVVFISTLLVNLAVTQLLLYKIVGFDVKRFFTSSYLKIIYVVIFILPIFFVKDFFHPGFLRCVLLSLFAVLWLLLVIYYVGLDNLERKKLTKILMMFMQNKKDE